MSSALRFHKLFPKNKRNQYGALENIDFDMSFPNRKLVCNSIYSTTSHRSHFLVMRDKEFVQFTSKCFSSSV